VIHPGQPIPESQWFFGAAQQEVAQPPNEEVVTDIRIF